MINRAAARPSLYSIYWPTSSTESPIPTVLATQQLPFPGLLDHLCVPKSQIREYL
jgi:hypothetical protein